MMKLLRYIGWIVALLVAGSWTTLSAQATESEIIDILNEKGIPEDTLKARLLRKGYNPDKITPDQIEEFQTVVVQTIAEIEADSYDRASQSDTIETTSDTIPTPPPPKKNEISTPKDTSAVMSTSIYGQHIFKNNSIQVYQQADALVPPEDYVIGPGDKIGVIGFGRSQFEQVMEVTSDGFIRPSALPRILVKGLTFANVKEMLYQRFSQYYQISRGEFQVTINRPRNITVNVFGEAAVPGSYTLPAFNTAFNIISAAGGPTNIGSVRNIKVISGDNVRTLDVYEFMSDPSVARNFFLQNNDFIHIPVAQKVVLISGAVTRPFYYELKDNENLTALLKFAGGTLPNGFLSDVQVVRFLDDRQVVTNVNYKALLEGGGDYVLYNGDRITIKTIEDDAFNFVEVTGAVQFPGKYERREGMRISDVLDQSRLRPESRLDYAYVLRHQPDNTYRYERVNLQNIIDKPSSADNILLNDRDQLRVVALTTYAEYSQFSVVGAVRKPDTFIFDPSGVVRLEDAILLAGGLTNEAYEKGYIIRRDPNEPKTVSYIHIDLRKAFDEPSSKENVVIENGDKIMVYNKSNLRENLTVSVFGAVRKPATFAYGPGMTLADVINLAGGFTFAADRQRIDIARTEFGSGQPLRITQYSAQLPTDFNINTTMDDNVEIMPYDHIYVREIPEFELQQTVTLRGEVKYPGVYAILQDNERISDIIERAGGLTGEAFADGARMYRRGDSTGLVVINLHEILANKNVPSNVALRAEDVIDIPKSRDLVTIGGNVNLDEAYSDGFLKGEKSISVAFRGEKSAKYYIDNFAAGVSEEGAPSEIKVQFADGRVEKAKKFLFFNSYPKIKRGAIITVGDKKVKPESTKEKEDINWGTVLRDTLTQATAVLTILILVDQLNK